MIVRHLVIHGRVQGVGFRYFAASSARALALSGWVRNLPDGSVELCAEGEAAELERLRSVVARGPAHSHITHIEEDWSDGSGTLAGFEIRR